MSIKTVQTEDSITIVVDSISLAGDEAKDFKKIIEELFEKGEKIIRLDLKKTEYIDSSGIGKVLFANKGLEKRGGKLTISAISPTLYDFFHSLALTRIMDITRPEQ